MTIRYERTKLQRCGTWECEPSFDGTFRTRLNESERGVIVIIASGCTKSDLIGHVLANEPGVWTHINLPMIAEPDEEIIFPLSGRVLNRKAGDLLFPQVHAEMVRETTSDDRLVFVVESNICNGPARWAAVFSSGIGSDSTTSCPKRSRV